MTDGNTYRSRRVRLDLVLLVLMIPGLLSALFLGVNRYKLESRNKAIELTLDYNEVQTLSASTGTPVSKLLSQFKSAGITGVAINEETLGSIQRAGHLSWKGQVDDTQVSPSDQTGRDALDRLEQRLPAGARSGNTVNASSIVLDSVGVGLSDAEVKTVQNAGLDVVARLLNNDVTSKRGIDAEIDGLKKQRIHKLIFAGEEVLGFKGLVPYTAEAIQRAGMTYGSIEFGKQKGDEKLCVKLKSDFIRVHSIPVAELAGMDANSAADRFAKAAKERNIRLCYVRLPETISENPVADGVDFVTKVRKQVEKSGFQIGEAHPYGTMNRGKGLLVLIALSIASAGVLLLNSLLTLFPKVKYGLLVGGTVVLAGLAMMGETGIRGLALLSTLIYPTLAVTAFVGPYFNGETRVKQPLKKTVLIFLGASAISLCGALLVVGLLADRSYMVKVSQFMGIKAAHLFPLLFVIGFMVAGLPILGESGAEVRRQVTENIRKALSNPLFVWHAFAVLFALIIVGLAVARTGNDSGVGVSGLELRFRDILDKVMLVRPRTKEFMFGHPAMLLGIGFLLSRRRAWGLPLVAFGMLGQVSMVNTFCHIHTPLAISILRVFNGLVLGTLIGIVAWMAIGKRIVNSRQGEE